MSDVQLYPVTVLKARYGGTYEGAPWVAIEAYPWDIPEEVMGDDGSCCSHFHSPAAERYGRGVTPNAAVDDLARRLAANGGCDR